MASDARPSIARNLGEALALTESLLAAAPTIEDLDAMVSKRAPLLDAAGEARDAGEPWGESEAALAQRILDADAKLLDEVFRLHADVFAWLRTRDEAVDATFPELAARRAVPRREDADARAEAQPGAGIPRTAAHRYERTRSAV